MMMFSSGDEGGAGGRIDDDLAAAQSLADVVVGVAFEFERHALRDERAEALARAAVEFQMHRVLRQSLPVLLRDLVAEDRADDAVDVADRERGRDFLAALDGGLADVEELREVERLLEAVILRLGAVAPDFGADRRLVEDLREIEALRLPVLDGLPRLRACRCGRPCR